MTLKRLKNIRKIQERKKKKDADDDNNDADSDDESEFRIKSKPKTMDEILPMTDAGLEDNDEDEENDSKKKVLKRKKKSSTYIAEEANGDTIVDFLDTSAAQKVRSSKPNITTKASSNAPAMKKKNEFELTPDGRLILKIQTTMKKWRVVNPVMPRKDTFLMTLTTGMEEILLKLWSLPMLVRENVVEALRAVRYQSLQ